MEDEQHPLVVGLLTLLYALPPQDAEDDVVTTCQLIGDNNIADKVLRRIQRPSKLIYDSVSERFFLGSDFNKIAAYYRSPYSYNFFTKDGAMVPEADVPQNDKRLRPNVKQIEEYMNQRFEVYRKCRYPNGVGSVYFWDIVEGEGWATSILFRNSLTLNKSGKEEIIWDSIHVIMQIPRSNQYIYRIKSTIYLTLKVKNSVIGEASWGGRVVKNTTTSRTVEDNAPTIYEDSKEQAEYLCSLVEEHEKTLSYQLREISLPKTRQTINVLRIINPVYAQIHEEITEKLNKSALREDRRTESRIETTTGGADTLKHDVGADEVAPSSAKGGDPTP